MSLPKNQHFVPQFYLRGFVDPVEESKGQKVLWLYERNRFPSRKSVKDVGYEEFFYEIGPDSAGSPEVKEAGYIERRLHHLEDLAVPTLAKLASGDVGLTSQERGEFAGFIALSMCRTPVYMQTVDKVAVNYHMASLRYWQEHPDVFERLMQNVGGESDGVSVESMRNYVATALKSGKEPKQTDRAWTLLWVFKSMIDFMDVFEAMRWRLLAAPVGHQFITCDNPVFFLDPRFRPGQPGESAKWSRDSLFMFPLSRAFTLCGEFRRGPDFSDTATKEELLRFTKTIVTRGLRQIYAPRRDNSLRDLVDEVHSERPPLVQSIPDKFFHDHFDKHGFKG